MQGIPPKKCLWEENKNPAMRFCHDRVCNMLSDFMCVHQKNCACVDCTEAITYNSLTY